MLADGVQRSEGYFGPSAKFHLITIEHRTLLRYNSFGTDEVILTVQGKERTSIDGRHSSLVRGTNMTREKGDLFHISPLTS
mmetsp:Transcript_25232/g.46884  ORF Transcript_25232/g.46884 Transcript_25232/m.46884 type:complete len:81 (-) Transcript_25232:142-384(-)